MSSWIWVLAFSLLKHWVRDELDGNQAQEVRGSPMIATGKTLHELTAADLMSRELTLVPQEMSLPAAAHLLSRAGVSGAPVVDETGRCVGVLSTTDFVHFVGGEYANHRRFAPRSAEGICEWQLIAAASLPTDAVRLHMTADPVTAEPDTPLSELAHGMLDAHIHRVVIVDADGRPTGLVSSTDILAAVAYAERG
jgi:CBS-domain-containing membrane protein